MTNESLLKQIGKHNNSDIFNIYLLLLSDQGNIDFSDYHVHVLTSVMKTFFRELPEPLLTFDLYDDFIRASGRYYFQDKLILQKGVVYVLNPAFCLTPFLYWLI